MKTTQITLLPSGKKLLNAQVINRDFYAQKNSFMGYVGSLLWIGAVLAFAYFFNPVCYLFAIPLPFMYIKEARRSRRRRRLQYYGIRRPCIDKCLAEYDESPDEWTLWFYNREGDYRVAATVTKEFYDATEIGEEFYLVFAHDERLPALWYRTSEWELDENSWKK